MTDFVVLQEHPSMIDYIDGLRKKMPADSRNDAEQLLQRFKAAHHLAVQTDCTGYPSNAKLSRVWAASDAAEVVLRDALRAALPTTKPVAWFRIEDGLRVYYETEAWPNMTPLYARNDTAQPEGLAKYIGNRKPENTAPETAQPPASEAVVELRAAALAMLQAWNKCDREGITVADMAKVRQRVDAAIRATSLRADGGSAKVPERTDQRIVKARQVIHDWREEDSAGHYNMLRDLDELLAPSNGKEER